MFKPSATNINTINKPTMTDEQLSITNLLLKHSGDVVVEGLSLTLAQGEVSCLLGPSGCGKSTLLRAIAGFEPVHQGTIQMQDQVLSDPNQQIPPEQRNIGMVFQDVALFPHLSVKQNIAYGLGHLSKQEQSARIAELLSLVGLPSYELRYPSSLSGGQQQRVALARALAPNPKLLLLDEPFSGLDALLSETLMVDVRQILVEQGITALIVTHDQTEAFALADHIAIMNKGRIEQWDTPVNIYNQPQTRFVADFIGQSQFLSARAIGANKILVEALGKELTTEKPISVDAQVEVMIRPDELVLAEQGDIKATIINEQFRGADSYYQLKLPNGQRLTAKASRELKYKIGDLAGIKLKPKNVIFF